MILTYAWRLVARNASRTATYLFGLALAVGLLSGILFFVDATARQMTATALAPVKLDMVAHATKPEVDTGGIVGKLSRERGILAAEPVTSADFASASKVGGKQTSPSGRMFAITPGYFKTFDILQVGTRLARTLIASRYRPDRLAQDMLIVGRDLQGLLETGPRLVRRFLRVWSHNRFAFEIKSPEIREIRYSLDKQSKAHVLMTMAFGFICFSIALSFQHPAESRTFYLPLPSWLFLGLAVSLSLGAAWVVRKSK